MLNNRLIKKIWLKQEEIPIMVIRSSAINWWPHYVLAFTFLIAAFFLMYYFWQYGIWGLSAFFVIVIFAVLVVIRSSYEHYFTGWVLTNVRLIDIYQRGFFHRELTEIVYTRIKDVHAKKTGIISGIFGLGDLYISLTDSGVRLNLAGVKGYDRAVAEIILQQENYENSLSSQKERRSQYALAKIKNKLGDKKFYELLGD